MTEQDFHKTICSCSPLPVCIVDDTGRVTAANPQIKTVLPYNASGSREIFSLTGMKINVFKQAAEENRELTFEKNDKIHVVTVKKLQDLFQSGEAEYILYFRDITESERLKVKHEKEQLCAAMIRIDNYDELSRLTPDENRQSLSAMVDKAIREWASRYEAAVVRESNSKYDLFFRHEHLQDMEDHRFEILDTVRDLETGADFPATLSIGVADMSASPVKVTEAAGEAMELAMGRGGDQAVVKAGDRLDYYGGMLEPVERGNKGKSRIIYYALTPIITAASNVIIMGHKNPDMDCFGAALGIRRLVCGLGREDVYIVLNEYDETMDEIIALAKEKGEYKFITSDEALALVNKRSLVFMLDNHRPLRAECPRLLEAGCNVVVIDHHRRASDAFANTVLSYTEPYVSSTCELVTEMLQFADAKKTIRKLEAEALLGGMTLDTNRFAVKTGVRTFEAASWLRRAGADTTAVKRFFQTDKDTFALRALGTARAEYLPNGTAVSICDSGRADAQVINSQVADELLTVKGIRASFVAGRNARGQTVVSARSLGDINVQRIMEKMGGGGHLTTAGTQLDITPAEAIEKIKELMEETVED